MSEAVNVNLSGGPETVCLFLFGLKKHFLFIKNVGKTPKLK